MTAVLCSLQDGMVSQPFDLVVSNLDSQVFLQVCQHCMGVCVFACERVKGRNIEGVERGGEERRGEGERGGRGRRRDRERGGQSQLLFLQVRGRSNFSTVGEWSDPEILTLQRVPPPANIEIQTNASLRDISRIQSGNNLMISLTIPLTWTAPSGLEEIDGYQAIISHEGTDLRYADPSMISDSVLRSVRIIV